MFLYRLRVYQHNSSCRTLYQLNDIWCECLPNYSGRYCSKYFEGVYIFLGNSNCHVVLASVLSILFNLTENESAYAINFIPPGGRFCSGTIDVNFWSNASYHYRRSLRIGRIYLYLFSSNSILLLLLFLSSTHFDNFPFCCRLKVASPINDSYH